MDEARKVIENILPNQLPYPSLNEVNYLAFSEISEEYHNELYGYIEEQGLLESYKLGKTLVQYVRVLRDGATRNDQITMTEYIRHQIHHPENTYNVRFNETDLKESIEAMRLFIGEQP